ncbi:MAG: hypothetical protein AAF610_01555 [Pseudomonadota bacterium]
MNKTIKSAAIAAGLALVATSASAIDIAENGGFETGDFTGWDVFPNAGSAMVTTLNPSTGTFAANVAVAGGAGNALIKNTVGAGMLIPGSSVTISFDARGATADGGVAFAELFSELAGGGVSSSEILGGGPLALAADPDVWTSFSFTTTLGPDVSGGLTVQFVAVCGAATTCNSDLYFDNLEIEVQAIPVPAAVWLFGSALGALGFGARRRG